MFSSSSYLQDLLIQNAPLWNFLLDFNHELYKAGTQRKCYVDLNVFNVFCITGLYFMYQKKKSDYFINT